MDPVTIGLVVGLASVWYPKTGEYLAILKHTGYDAYNEYLRPGIDRLRGNRPPLIGVKKVSPGNTFLFETIAITQSDGGKKTYDVTLKVADQNITLAELDFSNWRTRKDFTITITDKTTSNKEKVLDAEKDASEYESVLSTIEKVPLFLGNSNLSPDDTSKKINVAWNKPTGVAALDYGLEIFTVLYDKATEVVTGKGVVRKMDVDQDGGEKPHLAEKDFVDRLVSVVAKKDDPTLLENYFKVIENGFDNELKYAKREIKEREIAVAESAKVMRRHKIMLGLTIAITVLTVAAIVALIIFVPPIGTAAGILYGIYQSIVSSLGSSTRLVSGLKIATIGAITIGAAKVKMDYDKHNKLLEEKHLGKAYEGKNYLEKTIEDIKTKKAQAKRTLDCIKDLKDSKKDLLDLQSRKVGDKVQKIGNLEIKIITKYLKEEKLPTCNTLNLANNEISVSGLEDLTDVLKIQTTNLNVKNIDLRGNNIGKDGVDKIKDAMTQNLTLTEIQYDTKYKVSLSTKEGLIPTDQTENVDLQVQNEISQQSMINSYLQGVDFSNLQPKQRDIFFPQGESAIIAAAKEKVWKNTEVIEIPFTIRSNIHTEINACCKQNKLFAQTLSYLPTETVKAVNDFIQAFTIDHQRGFNWLRKNQDKNSLITVIQTIKEKPLLLQKFTPEGQKQFLISLGMPLAATEVLANLTKRFPKDIGDPLANTLETGLKEIIKLHDEKTIKAELEELAIKINDLALKERESQQQRVTLVTAFKNVLHPEVNQEEIDNINKLNKLRDLVASLDPQKEVPDEFFAVYRTIDLKYLTTPFENFKRIDFEKFMNIIRKDVYESSDKPMYANIKKLDPAHRVALLEFCFKDETDTTKAKQKAQLISNMLSQPNMFATSGAIIASYLDPLYYAIKWPRYTITKTVALGFIAPQTGTCDYDYYKDKIKKDLYDEKAKPANEKSQTQVTMLEDLLQSSLQMELVDKYHCLQTTSDQGLNDLQKDLGQNLELRDFKPSNQMNEKAKNFIMHITTRNKLHDAITNENKLEEFRKHYLTLPKNKIEDYLNEICQLNNNNKSGLLKLITDDIDSGCTELQKFADEDLTPKRSALLLWCLKTEPQLIATFKTKRQDFLMTGDNDKAEILEKPLQLVLQTKLKNDYIKVPYQPSDFLALKKSLLENTDLRNDFELPPEMSQEKPKPEIAKLLNEAVLRNQLHDAITYGENNEKKFKAFLKICKTIPTDEFTSLLEAASKLNNGTNKNVIINLVKADIENNKYAQLTALSESEETKLTALLASCLKKDPEDLTANGVATLVAKLITLKRLNNPLIKDEHLWRAFDWRTYTKWGFNQYLEEINKIIQNESSKQPPNTKDVQELKTALQLAIQEDLKTRYTDCFSRKGLAKSLPKLKEELNDVDQKDLIDPSFVQNTGLLPSVQLYVEYICKRNMLGPENEEVKNAYQLVIQNDLKTKYQDCFTADGNASSLPDLKEELKNNRDLTDSSFVKGKKLSQEVENYVDFICGRNTLTPAIEESDLNLFMKSFANINPENCQELLKELDPNGEKTLEMLTADLGENKYILNCENLQELDKQHRSVLIEHHYLATKETADDAKEKANLIAELLDIKDLFDPQLQTDKNIQNINYGIYYAIEPWTCMTSAASYNLEGLKKYLAKTFFSISKDTSTNDIIINLKDIIDNAKIQSSLPTIKKTEQLTQNK